MPSSSSSDDPNQSGANKQSKTVGVVHKVNDGESHPPSSSRDPVPDDGLSTPDPAQPTKHADNKETTLANESPTMYSVQESDHEDPLRSRVSSGASATTVRSRADSGFSSPAVATPYVDCLRAINETAEPLANEDRLMIEMCYSEDSDRLKWTRRGSDCEESPMVEMSYSEVLQPIISANHEDQVKSTGWPASDCEECPLVEASCEVKVGESALLGKGEPSSSSGIAHLANSRSDPLLFPVEPAERSASVVPSGGVRGRRRARLKRALRRCFCLSAAR